MSELDNEDFLNRLKEKGLELYDPEATPERHFERFTANLRLYRVGSSTQREFPIIFSDEVTSEDDNEVYERIAMVKKAGRKLDFGWYSDKLETISEIVVINRGEGRELTLFVEDLTTDSHISFVIKKDHPLIFCPMFGDKPELKHWAFELHPLLTPDEKQNEAEINPVRFQLLVFPR